jgi:hypothetical protein
MSHSVLLWISLGLVSVSSSSVLVRASLGLVTLAWVLLVTIRVHTRKCNGGCNQGRAPCVCAMQEWE